MIRNKSDTAKAGQVMYFILIFVMIMMIFILISHCLMPAGQKLFALPKKYPKTLVQKKAIALHRSLSCQNAYSIAFKFCFFK